MVKTTFCQDVGVIIWWEISRFIISRTRKAFAGALAVNIIPCILKFIDGKKKKNETGLSFLRPGINILCIIFIIHLKRLWHLNWRRSETKVVRKIFNGYFLFAVKSLRHKTRDTGTQLVMQNINPADPLKYKYEATTQPPLKGILVTVSLLNRIEGFI